MNLFSILAIKKYRTTCLFIKRNIRKRFLYPEFSSLIALSEYRIVKKIRISDEFPSVRKKIISRNPILIKINRDS